MSLKSYSAGKYTIIMHSIIKGRDTSETYGCLKKIISQTLFLKSELKSLIKWFETFQILSTCLDTPAISLHTIALHDFMVNISFDFGSKSSVK